MTTQTKSTTRINARLDRDVAKKLEDLMRAEGRSVTDIIRAAIAHYHEARYGASAEPAVALKRSGFIGCGEGEPNLSRDYKRVLSKSLARKHDYR